MSNHIFPIVLDGAVQPVTEADEWNGKTSYVDISVNGTYNFTISGVDSDGRDVPVGALLTIYRTAASTSAVSIMYDSTAIFTLDAATENVVLMWDGSGFRTISNSSATGSVSTNSLTLSGNLTVNGNTVLGNEDTDTIGMYGVTPTAQQASADQAALSLTDVTSVNADVQANFAAIQTLVNEIRTNLVTIGLIKGEA